MIVSLWNIPNEATVMHTENFYKNFVKDKDIDESLKKT